DAHWNLVVAVLFLEPERRPGLDRLPVLGHPFNHDGSIGGEVNALEIFRGKVLDLDPRHLLDRDFAGPLRAVFDAPFGPLEKAQAAVGTVEAVLRTKDIMTHDVVRPITE